MSRFLSILLLVVLGVVFFGATLRGSFGNPTTTKQLQKAQAPVGSPFESSHERASYAEMIQMRKNDTIALKDGLHDFAAPDVGYYNGNYYSYFPPGISLMIRPFFELGFPYNLSQIAAYSSMALIGIATMVFIFLIGKNVFNLPSYISVFGAVIYAFATTSWSYSITIFQHAPAALFAAVMFYGVSRYRDRVKTSALWASAVWLTYGLSISFDYPNAILLAPFIAYYLMAAFEVMKEEQKVNFKVNMAHLGVIIWFIIAVGAHFTFNAVYTDSWATIRQSYDRYDPKHAQLILEQDAKSKVLTVTSENIDPTVEQRIKMPFLEEVFFSGLVTLLVAPDKGLFFFSPVLIFGLVGIVMAFRMMPPNVHGPLLSFMVVNLITYASFGDPYGGWAFGPRYLIPSMVGYAVYAAYAFHHLKKPALRALFYFTFLFSMSIAAAGALTSNNVPPRVEADYLKLKDWNYSLNFHLIDAQKTGSFVYNTYLKAHMNLGDYYVLIVLSLGLFTYFLLFVIPLLFKPKK